MIGAAFEVHNELGGGLREEIYQKSLEIELASRSIPFDAKPSIDVHYKHRRLDVKYVPDLIAFTQWNHEDVDAQPTNPAALFRQSSSRYRLLCVNYRFELPTERREAAVGWWIRTTRFSDVHLVFSQEADTSCALACAKMVVFKINKLSPGSKKLYQETEVENAYLKYETDAAAYAQFGAEVSAITSTLNDLGCGQWTSENPAETDMPEKVLDTLGSDVVGLGPIVNSAMRGHPIILLIGWGHYVVVDTVNKIPLYDKYWASVCDPWDGNVHITAFEKGRAFRYEGAEVPWSVDLWGDRYNYDTTNVGNATHIIYRTD